MTSLRTTASTSVRGRGTVIFARFSDGGPIRVGARAHVALVGGGEREVVVRSYDAAPRLGPDVPRGAPIVALLVDGIGPEEVAIDADLRVEEGLPR